MKKNTRILCLLLALTLFAGMALGSGSKPDDDNKDIVPGNTTGGSTAVTIQEQVLLDQDGVKITAKEYVTNSIFGDGIKVLVENNGSKNVGVSCNALIVNNYMITDLFSATVATGKKANETIYLSSSSLEAAGIDNVGQIELSFHVYNSDNFSTLFDTQLLTIQTSAYAQMDTTPADAGTELYNKDGIRIVGKYVDEDSFWGTSVLLYLENKNGQDLTISCENMSVNGFMVTPLFYSTVYNNKMAVDPITILSTDLENNQITSVEQIEVSFRIYNSSTYETIAETGPITINAK